MPGRRGDRSRRPDPVSRCAIEICRPVISSVPAVRRRRSEGSPARCTGARELQLGRCAGSGKELNRSGELNVAIPRGDFSFLHQATAVRANPVLGGFPRGRGSPRHGRWPGLVHSPNDRGRRSFLMGGWCDRELLWIRDCSAGSSYPARRASRAQPLSSGRGRHARLARPSSTDPSARAGRRPRKIKHNAPPKRG